MRACLLVLLLCGCWKRDTVVLPKLTFEVRSPSGAVEGARVRLMTITDPYHRRAALNEVLTDASGRVSFDEKREKLWVFPLMMHGVTFYSWQWCVEAPGFSAQVVTEHDSLGGTREVALLPATSPEQCDEISGGFAIVK